MIQGYPDQPSIFPGEKLTFHVSTDAFKFRVEFYRHGADLVYQFMSGWMPGVLLPSLPADQDWGLDREVNGDVLLGWPTYSFDLPANTTPGVYIAKLVEFPVFPDFEPVGESDTYRPTGQMLLVVKNPRPGSEASILYKLPLFTYQAYNTEGGGSLYVPDAITPDTRVTIRRPGGGTGGTPLSEDDPNDPDTPRQTYAHWDAWFVSWLAKNGYRVDFCTDLDIHSPDAPALLACYRVMLSVGHDEYWTAQMRDHVENYIGGGGNVAFFSGNTCWWQLVFDDPTTIRRHANWYQVIPARPENFLTGVTSKNVGDIHDPHPVGYQVQHHDHWVFAGTGLSDGDTFGEYEQLVGYECDGANYDRADGPPFHPKGDDGTPANFLILGVGDARPVVPPELWPNANYAATMGVYVRNGTVFTAGTIDWPRVVAKNNEGNTVQITRNVLRRLGGLESAEYPYAFVVGSDGQLWVNWWDGAAWHWANQGTPPSAGIAASVGALTVMDDPNAPQRPYVFVVGSDGQLGLNWWDNAGWNWATQGMPPSVGIAASVGVLTVMDDPNAAQRPYAFVVGSDGKLWINWWDSAAWHWANQGTPPSASIAASVGVLTVMDDPNAAQRPYALVVGSDGQLWINWWDGAAWHWANRGTPPSAGIVASVGVLTKWVP